MENEVDLRRERETLQAAIEKAQGELTDRKRRVVDVEEKLRSALVESFLGNVEKSPVNNLKKLRRGLLDSLDDLHQILTGLQDQLSALQKKERDLAAQTSRASRIQRRVELLWDGILKFLDKPTGSGSEEARVVQTNLEECVRLLITLDQKEQAQDLLERAVGSKELSHDAGLLLRKLLAGSLKGCSLPG